MDLASAFDEVKHVSDKNGIIDHLSTSWNSHPLRLQPLCVVETLLYRHCEQFEAGRTRLIVNSKYENSHRNASDNQLD